MPAGALFAFFGRYASASYMVYHVSGEAVVWTIVGGAGTLLGPLSAPALLIVFREIVSTVWENYLLAVGVHRHRDRDVRAERHSSAPGTTAVVVLAACAAASAAERRRRSRRWRAEVARSSSHGDRAEPSKD